MAAAPEFPAWAVEEAARQLQITLRQLRQAQGTLYFCTLPSGLRFDLYAGLDGTLQCWRLVDGSRWEKDRRMECRDPSRNGPAVGGGTHRGRYAPHLCRAAHRSGRARPGEENPEIAAWVCGADQRTGNAAPGAVNCWVIHIARQSWYTGTRKNKGVNYHASDSKSSSGTQSFPLDAMLLAQRTVFLTGEINTSTVNAIIQQLLFLESADATAPIKLIITSPGGTVQAGLAPLYDQLKGMTVPIDLYCVELAASMAAVILAGGRRGHRFILRHSMVMIHEPQIASASGGVCGSASSIQKTAESILTTKRRTDRPAGTGHRPPGGRDRSGHWLRQLHESGRGCGLWNLRPYCGPSVKESTMKRDSLVVAEGCVLSGDEVGRTRPNANALIVGTTGCGKSTSVILPTVARMHCSNPILSYAKERDAYLMAEYLKRKNYMVHILNAAHPKKSTLSYDPIASIESYADIEALSAAIVDMSIRKSVDDYWQVKAKQLLSGLIAGCFMTSKGSRMPGMADVLALFDKTIPCENAYGVEPELYGMFQRLEKASPGCFAVREFNSWRSLPERTASCVRDTLAGALSTVFPESIRRMMREKPQFDPVRFASRKEALLVITSAADTAQQYYANLFYRSTEQQLLPICGQLSRR